MQYKQIEEVLSKVFSVSPAKRKAFRARLRYLRNIGVPYDLQTPGSGSPISYTRDHLVELLIALELETLGIPPRRALSLYNEVLRFPLHDVFGPDIYMILRPSGFLSDDIPPSITVQRLENDELGELIKGSGPVCVVNLSSLLQELDGLCESQEDLIPRSGR